MDGIISVIHPNGPWLKVIAIVAIGARFRYREHESKIQRDLHTRELKHHQRKKEVKVELEKANAKRNAEKSWRSGPGLFQTPGFIHQRDYTQPGLVPRRRPSLVA